VGEKIKARRVLDRALEQAKRQYVCRFIVATAYAELGEDEKALESLQQGFLQRST
jgi:Tfp pilus assembly protein PilF